MARRAVEALEDTVLDAWHRVRRSAADEQEMGGEGGEGGGLSNVQAEQQGSRPEQLADGASPAEGSTGSSPPSYSDMAAHGEGRVRHNSKKMHCTKKSILFHFSAEFLKNDSASRFGDVYLCARPPARPARST